MAATPVRDPFHREGCVYEEKVDGCAFVSHLQLRGYYRRTAVVGVIDSVSRRMHAILVDSPVTPDVLLLTLMIIGLVCAIACYFAVGSDQPRRPTR
jgi:hypothetical protein